MTKDKPHYLEDKACLIVYALCPFIVIVGLTMLMTSCSLISINQGGSKSKSIPQKPAASERMESTVQKEAQVANDTAIKVCAGGTTPRSRDAKQLVASTDKIVTYLGKPAVPIDIEKDPLVQNLHKQFEEEMTKHRQAERLWTAELDDLRAENAKLTETAGTWSASFANLKFWFWVCIIVIAGLCFLFPALIPVFIRIGKRGVTAVQNQLEDVVEQVQAIRKDPDFDDKARAKIDEKLKRMKGDTAITISKIKAAWKKMGK